MDGFKKYISRGRAGIPKISIRKNGQIAFNAGAIQKYDLNVYDFVMLYVSDKKDRVAVQFTNNEKDSGIIKIQKRPGNFAFSARNFLQIYDILWDETVNFDFIWNESGKKLHFRQCRYYLLQFRCYHHHHKYRLHHYHRAKMFQN